MPSNSKTAETLQQVLVDSYATLIATHRFHWNVETGNFYAWHKLAEDIYTEQFAAVDEIAERIRALDKKPDLSPEVLAKTTTIKAGDDSASLLAAQEAMVAILKKLEDVADDEDDSVTQDLANARMAQHEKNIWMIKTQIKAGK